MRFIKVNELPEKEPRCEYKSVAPKLFEFLDMGVKYAKVDFYPYEYTNFYSAAATFRTLAKYHKLPIHSICINGEVYLIRTDMEGLNYETKE